MIGTQDTERARRRREETYALRRTLVRRLQVAARGVTRRERVELHRHFAVDWRALVAAGHATPDLTVSRLHSEWGPRVDHPSSTTRDQAELFELDLIA